MSNLSSMKSNPPVSPMHHKSRLERDSELEELRKMRITKHLKREKSMEIEVLEEKYRNEQTKRIQYVSQSTKKNPSYTHTLDPWAMQQRARAEEERRRRTEAQTYMHGGGYKFNSHQMHIMRQKQQAAEDRRKRIEAESYLHGFRGVAPEASEKRSITSSPRTLNNSNGIDYPSSPYMYGDLSEDMSKITIPGHITLDQPIDLDPKIDFYSNKLPKQEKSETEQNESKILIPPKIVSNIVLKDEKNLPEAGIGMEQFEKNKDNYNKLSNSNDEEESKLNPGGQNQTSSSTVAKNEESEILNKTLVPNWTIDLSMSFASKRASQGGTRDQSSENKGKEQNGSIKEKWKIDFMLKINFLSQRMNKIAGMKSGEIQQKFAQQFTDLSASLVKQTLERCINEDFPFRVRKFSAEAVSNNESDGKENILESPKSSISVENFDPIKVLVVVELRVVRKHDSNKQKFRQIIVDGMRSAITYQSLHFSCGNEDDILLGNNKPDAVDEDFKE